MKNEALLPTPLFQGLARPPMTHGVPHSFMIINIAFCMMYFVLVGSFWSVALFVFLHSFGRICCLYDANFFGLLAGFF